jgi:hypothetical protein
MITILSAISIARLALKLDKVAWSPCVKHTDRCYLRLDEFEQRPEAFEVLGAERRQDCLGECDLLTRKLEPARRT